MDDRLKAGLEAVTKKGIYADIRLVEFEEEEIFTKNGRVERISHAVDAGLGVRCLAEGAWGFAATSDDRREAIVAAAGSAERIARASALAKKADVRLARKDPARGQYRTQVTKDPFEASPEEKIGYLLKCDERLRSVKRVTFAECWIHAWRQRKCYADTEGSDVEQEFTGIHFGVRATAIRGNDLQTRTYPAFHGHGLHRGLELLDEFDPLGQCERVADEAVMLLDAQPCPGTTTDLVLLPPAVCILVHESLGHPTELDRVLGSEANFAGTSHLTQEKLGKFRFGSDLVTIVADATIPGGMGSFWFDDEGVPGQRVELVRNGIFVGYQSSRESSLVLGLGSNGTMRAQRWCHMPLVRMTNINLEPAQGSLDDMLAETDGYLLDGFKSVSIDDRRLNFSLGAEVGWRIKNGKRRETIRNPVVSGISTDYWRSVDFVGGRQSWILYGIPSCGKGEPHQIMRVGHGAPPVRFRKVKLGN